MKMNDTETMSHLQSGVTLTWKDFPDINEKNMLEWETGAFQRSQVRVMAFDQEENEELKQNV